MNVVKKALLAGALVATSFSSQAIENNFTFEVYSSGPNIYACNAGIKHQNIAETAGYVVGDNDTAAINPGDYLQDAYYYTFKEVFENDWYLSSDYDESGHKRATGGSNYVLAKSGLYNFSTSQALNLNAHRVGGFNGNPRVLTNLHFELSSEVYGTEYFVDICYYGSRGMADHYRVGTNLIAKSSATFTDISNILDKDYKQLSGLKTKATLVCRRGNSVVSEASTSWTSISNNLKQYWSNVNIINNSNGYDSGPSKCVVRYSFKETNTDKLRVNIEHNMQVKLNTQITDPAAL